MQGAMLSLKSLESRGLNRNWLWLNPKHQFKTKKTSKTKIFSFSSLFFRYTSAMSSKPMRFQNSTTWMSTSWSSSSSSSSLSSSSSSSRARPGSRATRATRATWRSSVTFMMNFANSEFERVATQPEKYPKLLKESPWMTVWNPKNTSKKLQKSKSFQSFQHFSLLSVLVHTEKHSSHSTELCPGISIPHFAHIEKHWTKKEKPSQTKSESSESSGQFLKLDTGFFVKIPQKFRLETMYGLCYDSVLFRSWSGVWFDSALAFLHISKSKYFGLPRLPVQCTSSPIATGSLCFWGFQAHQAEAGEEAVAHLLPESWTIYSLYRFDKISMYCHTHKSILYMDFWCLLLLIRTWIANSEWPENSWHLPPPAIFTQRKAGALQLW